MQNGCFEVPCHNSSAGKLASKDKDQLPFFPAQGDANCQVFSDPEPAANVARSVANNV
jgi:hypothetical protein